MGEVVVEVKNARKSFIPHEPVLNGLNMCVMKNTIYGLLGPSGCGKTILLSCILGRRLLDSGEIHLSINNRRDVGYMPQEVALFLEFTIKEIFNFYGKLFGFTSNAIKDRVRQLQHVLNLPHWSNRIGDLSGGEQRRVSFAVALLHDPPLLILDEPTVGVDTVLSHNIWQYLIHLTREGKTIIITTHYVEEAKQAHKIGLMRGGVLLCEDSPLNVMASQNTSSLEDAFFVLSKKQDEERGSEVKKVKIYPRQSCAPPLQNGDLFNKNRFNAQLIKNVCWMKRNTLIMFFLLLLPAMQSFFYCISFGQNPTDLKTILVSDELNLKYGNKSYCQSIVESKGTGQCSMTPPHTCNLLAELEKLMAVEIYDSIERGRQTVLHNKAWGLIYIPKNFSEYIYMRLTRNFTEAADDLDAMDDMEYRNAIDLAIDRSSVSVTLDMSNYIIANFLRKKIVDAFLSFQMKFVQTCSLPSRANSFIRFMKPVFGNMDPVYAHSGLPGFFCSFCFYFTMIFTSGAIMMEKLVGLLDRSMVAGLTYLEVVTAHLAVQFVLMSAQKCIMMIVFYVCYDNPLEGSVVLIVALLFCIETVGIAYGFLLTEVFSCDRLVSYAGIGATLAVFSLGGIIWPIEGAHPVIRSWVWLFPVTPAVDSYKGISSKGYNLMNRVVYSGFISCISWTILFGLATVIVAKARRSHSIL